MNRLRRSSSSDDGFTLIELLVVILIIGILAAIAIPAFLNQKSKATDSAAKELARTAQTTAETIGLDNGGSYEKVTPTELRNVEKTILTAEPSAGGAYISAASGTATTFTVTAKSGASSGNTFTISRTAEAVTRTCVTAGKGSCPSNASW